METTVTTSGGIHDALHRTRDWCDPIDGCSNVSTPLRALCDVAFDKAVLRVTETTPGKEKLPAKLLKGEGVARSDFGALLESGGPAYGLCIFDDADALVALEVGRPALPRPSPTPRA